MEAYLKDSGPESDIVISSRIRIARNMEGLPFPHYLSVEKANEVISKVYESAVAANEITHEKFCLISMKDVDKVERLNYVEKHLISPHLAKNIQTGNILLNKEETINIMINEEDHIRIQCLLPGLQLEKAWNMASKIDDLLGENIDYVFDEKLGFITACPTNLGTGIRASVMLHLPALSMTGYIRSVLQAANQIGLAVRGTYGEGTEFLGNLYQISNQVTLGLREEEIVTNLHAVTLQIIQKEKEARQILLDSKRIQVEDKVFRSYGVLKNARMITRNEAMELISDVILGINLNLINEISLEKINKLMTIIQPGYIQKYFKKELDEKERDLRRAELIREIL
jgi:protein arginine kinase